MAQNGLNGLRSLSYMGVNAPQPPNINTYNRAPTINDYNNFIIGDLWINILPAPAIFREVYMLVALERPTPLTHVARWIKLSGGGGGGGGILQTRTDDTLVEIPDLTGTLNIDGGEPYVVGATVVPADYYTNIYTKRRDANSVWVSLTRSIHQPITNLSATEGMYSLGGSNFLFAYGTNNTACGIDAINLTLDVPTCTDTTAIGFNTLHSIFDGAGNTGIGSSVLTAIDSGSDNIAIGYLAGDSYTTSESDNILIGNLGVILDANTIRIGIQGNGAAEQNQVFIAGIWNSPAVPATNTGLVIVDLNGQLYVDDLAPESILATDIGGNPIGLQGLAGTVLTGMGIGTLPQFLPLTSTGGSVTITTDPVTHSINLEAAGVAALTTLTTDTGAANPLLGNINVVGGELINTDNLVANTVTINLNRGANDQVVAGTGASPATYKYLWSSDGSITLDFLSDPTKIDFTNNGTPPVGGITYLTGDSGPNATPIAGAVSISGGKNIYTVSSVGDIQVNVTNDVDLLGHLYATTDIKTSAGDLITTTGNVILPDTAAGGGGGTIIFGGTGIGGHRWISNYGSESTFVGEDSGNASLITATALRNTFLGAHSGNSINGGPDNTGCGAYSLNTLTDGQQNTALGLSALKSISTSSYMLALGYHAGFNYTSVASNSNICLMHPGVNGETNTMRLGVDGIGARQINASYMAGVYSKVAGPTPLIVTIGSDGKLGTGGAVPGGGAAIFLTDGAPANVAGSTIQIKGLDNINTTGAGNTVTVHLDQSVIQPITNVTGDQGVYALGSSGSYLNDRFLHNWGGGLGLSGYSTYVGNGAGRIAANSVGVKNSVVGAHALMSMTSANNNSVVGQQSMSVATSASHNSILGSGNGAALTTGGYNTLLGQCDGYAPGYDLTTGSSNIFINSSSTPTASNELRIGLSTGTGVAELNAAYIQGIYQKTVGATATPVVIDSSGKLGTAGAVAFEYYILNDVVNITGDNTIWNFGGTTPHGKLTKSYDITNSVYPGNGAGSDAYFLVPYTGYYNLQANVMYYWHYVEPPTPPPTPSPIGQDSPLYIITPRKSYWFHATPYNYAAAVSDVYISEVLVVNTYLEAGDQVWWAAQQFAFATSKTITIKGVMPNAGGIGSDCFSTWISGHRIG